MDNKVFSPQLWMKMMKVVHGGISFYRVAKKSGIPLGEIMLFRETKTISRFSEKRLNIVLQDGNFIKKAPEKECQSYARKIWLLKKLGGEPFPQLPSSVIYSKLEKPAREHFKKLVSVLIKRRIGFLIDSIMEKKAIFLSDRMNEWGWITLLRARYGIDVFELARQAEEKNPVQTMREF